MAFKPSTPSVAAPIGSVPSYDVPIIVVAPVVQYGSTGLLFWSYAVPWPLNQSMTAFIARFSSCPPIVGQPVDSPVPSDCA